MRRSAQVFAPLLASAAVSLLSGCGPEMQRCVDQQNHVVDPSFCKNLPPAQTGTSPGYIGGSHPFLPYRYYYGGGGGYGYGTVVNGGSFAPQSGHSYSVTSGTTRGGFGGLFSGAGGGGGGEGE